MDSKTRKAALARDAGVLRIKKTTRLIGTFAVGGGLIMAAGFAHVLPTHLPQVNVGRDNGGNGGSSNGSGGLQGPNNAPGGGSGSSQVTSGGS